MGKIYCVDCPLLHQLDIDSALVDAHQHCLTIAVGFEFVAIYNYRSQVWLFAN